MDAPEIPNIPAEPRTGFCQECGRGLSVATLRRVGNGIFCIPCAIRQAAPGWQPVPPVPLPATAAGAPPASAAVSAGGPNPARAAVFGLIPGVGAMYNGQYAKGALHLVVFVILLSLADHLYWGFDWFVWGWVFYQAFDAYHTARARRDGLPLPNPFGWNDVGERLGFVRPTASTATPPAATPPVAAASHTSPAWAAYTSATTAAEGSPSRPFAERPSENPYAEPFNRSAAPPFADPFAPAPPPIPPVVPPGMQAAYRPTFTGGATPGSSFIPPPLSGVRRFPLGALWLIGLGLLFLVGNLLPELRLSGRWLVPLLLAAVAFWSALRRWEQLCSTQGFAPSPLAFAGTIVGPALLVSVAALLALDAGNFLSMRRSWPAVLVVWGCLLTLQRTRASAPVSSPVELPGAVPPPGRSTSGTGSLGL